MSSLKTARLQLRAHEKMSFYNHYIVGSYAFALVPTPAFPGEAHPECSPYTIICAAPYRCTDSKRSGEILWGWVQLDSDTKDIIGETIEEEGIEPPPGLLQ